MSENCQACALTMEQLRRQDAATIRARQDAMREANSAATVRVMLEVMTERAERAESGRDALRAELARLTTWHPEREPPDDSRYVLVCLSDGDQDMDRYFHEDGWWSWHGGDVTHWRELPPGPEVTP